MTGRPEDEGIASLPDAESEDEDYLDEDVEDDGEVVEIDERHGVPPAECRKLGLQRLNHKHEVIAYHLASGIPRVDIARDLRMTPDRISTLANDPLMKARVKELREKHYGGNIDKRLKHLTPKAVNLLEEAVEFGGVSTERITAAKYLIDQSRGKPVQRHEIQTNLLSDFMDVLDRMGNRRLGPSGVTPKDVIDTNAVPIHAGKKVTDEDRHPMSEFDESNKSDSFDVWIDNNLGD